MDIQTSNPTPGLREYLGVVARRKWLILPFVILTPLAAYVTDARRPHVYAASAQVLLSSQSSAVSGLNDPGINQPDRSMRTQSQIVRLPAVAAIALRSAGSTMSTGSFLGESSVEANDQQDLMTLLVKDRDPAVAVKLATAYARAYITYRASLDTSALRQAQAAIAAEVRRVKREGLINSPLYASLVDRQQQLSTAMTLASSNALLVRAPDGAGQVAPLPKRLALLGLLVGLVLGFGGAFLAELLDTRLASPEDIAASLDVPLLTTLAEPPRRIRARNQVVMLAEPHTANAEGFRILRSRLVASGLGETYKTLLVTSSLMGAGKSTTAVNISVALARAGHHVTLLDLDLRRPSLGNFFSLGGRPGITDITAGRATIEESLTVMTFSADGSSALEELRARSSGEAGSNGSAPLGRLEIVGPGTAPANPGEFAEISSLAEVLAKLRARADVVVVDGPPLLLAGESMDLASMLDALIVVERLGLVRKAHIDGLNRTLATCQAQTLGVIVTGVDASESAAYSYYGHPSPRVERSATF
jgi:Mrp family chromosome partitioning ATPase/capsular polysaccharide biosynthesis protein